MQIIITKEKLEMPWAGSRSRNIRLRTNIQVLPPFLTRGDPWAGYFLPLCLSFLVFQRKLVIVPTLTALDLKILVQVRGFGESYLGF